MGNNGKIWKLLVVLLLICNAGIIAFMWLRPCRPPVPPPPPAGGQGEQARNFVIRTLNFTDEQVRQYDVLIGDHRRAMDSLRKVQSDARQQLFGGLKNGTDPNVAAQTIAACQKEIETVTFHHFEKVRVLCTDAQKPEFDNIIGEVIKKMNGGNRRPPHPGGPGDGPPPPPQGAGGPMPPPPPPGN